MKGVHSLVDGTTAVRRARMALLAVIAVLAIGTSDARAAEKCPTRSIQWFLDNTGSTTEPAGANHDVFAWAKVRIGTRCKTGRPGHTYSARICVRHPGNVVRCRTQLFRSNRFSSFIVATGGGAWRYRVSWAHRAGSPVVLRDFFTTYTGNEPPASRTMEASPRREVHDRHPPIERAPHESP